jgi:hypothetical protein
MVADGGAGGGADGQNIKTLTATIAAAMMMTIVRLSSTVLAYRQQAQRDSRAAAALAWGPAARLRSPCSPLRRTLRDLRQMLTIEHGEIALSTDRQKADKGTSGQPNRPAARCGPALVSWSRFS